MLPINNENTKIDLSRAAFEQICLIRENDFTLEGKIFRLKIEGKGCEGFEYATGFSQKQDQDIELLYHQGDKSVRMLLDPFTAHYCQLGQLDYLFDITGQEGFVFQNENEHKYHGKFFTDDSMLPPEDLNP